MLRLNNIVKDYRSGDTTVHALKGISIEFRRNEFVSILGPSGCGKTTLLNIIGGLDRYTSGDLFINNVSTKEFKDRKWDSYRNHSIGFVFQSYNLIPHQTVLSNVELALTLSGVNKSERRKRAIEVLEKVGLGDQIHKKPNQMSGGQMQRVAIARALVNNPEILLADEPTGALDSETSIQIMELLKEISTDKLVIMVTHNPELASQYSSRIVNLLDGELISDTDPYRSAQAASVTDNEHNSGSRTGKVNMSFFTALSLSFKNLLTKKTRTFLTAFAGSIGIIGIALILSLSNGFQEYINKVQEDTISTYPISIEKETVDMTSLMQSMMGNGDNRLSHELDKIYTNNILQQMLDTMLSEIQENNLSAFKQYLDSGNTNISDYANAVQYVYDVPMNIYKADTSDGIVQVNPNTVFNDIYGIETPSDSSASSALMSTYSNTDLKIWSQMIDNQKLLESQYDVIAGRWPSSYNEVILVADENNEITDITLYSLGLKDQSEVKEMMQQIYTGQEVNTTSSSYTYEELLGLEFKLVPAYQYYKFNTDNNLWEDMSKDSSYVRDLIKNGIDIKITGIIRPAEEAVATSISGSIGYTSALKEYLINETNNSEIVKAQVADPDTDVFTGVSFTNGTAQNELTMDDVNAYISSLPEDAQKQIAPFLKMLSEDQIIEMFSQQMGRGNSDATYENNVSKLGIADLSSPTTINIYAKDFESKDKISEIIEKYNSDMTASGKEELVITYTDYIGLMMSSISTIINTISYVLIAFVSVSLIVSSIMIGIITYISVLERTKEIGVLRSIGASKKDVSRVFNAETMIVGFVSGTLGILITMFLDIPINMVIKKMSDISNVAKLPVAGAVILVLISILLTLIAGLIPSRLAARKDPVVALRSE